MVGAGVGGWAAYADAYGIDGRAAAAPGQRRATDRMLLYFTSGTTSRPKLVEHTHVSYPVGHLSTMYWLGLQPGDVHLNISSPGWAKHAWSCFFAPWLAEATIFVYNYARFDAARAAGPDPRPRGDHVLRAADGLADAHQGRPVRRAGALREAIAAGEPLNPEVISQVERSGGSPSGTASGRPRRPPASANTPGQPVKPGSMGRPLPGVPVVLVDPSTGAVVDGAGEGEICLDLSAARR